MKRRNFLKGVLGLVGVSVIPETKALTREPLETGVTERSMRIPDGFGLAPVKKEGGIIYP